MTGHSGAIEFFLGAGIGMLVAVAGIALIHRRAYQLAKDIPDTIRNPYSGAHDIASTGFLLPWGWPLKRPFDPKFIPAYSEIRKKLSLFFIAWVAIAYAAVAANIALVPFGIPLFSAAAFYILWRNLPRWWTAPKLP